MIRRDFLKALCISPLVLCVKGRPLPFDAAGKCGERGCCVKCVKKNDCYTYATDRIILENFGLTTETTG